MNLTAERLNWALSSCEKAQLRLTPARELVLAYLAAHPIPSSLESIAQADDIRDRCDATTIYRTLMLLREVELVRQVGLPGKVSYFMLNAPGAGCEFLVCRLCGRIVDLELGRSIEKLARGAAASHGFTSSYYEVEVYGVCPSCQQRHRARVLPTKSVTASTRRAS